MAEPHFPSRLHLFVWRNWELANADRMAKVIRTTPETILELGAAMGLPAKPRLSDDQLARIYITVIRQNWRVLPEEQIIELLGWTRQRFEFTLKEDDFLAGKLGLKKPRCAELVYTPPTTAKRPAPQRFALPSRNLALMESAARRRDVEISAWDLNPVRTLAGLVGINSINPAHAQGRPEAEIQAYVLDFFRRHDISACEQPAKPGRANAIGILPGRVSGKRLVFEVHSDTAGIEGMTVPPFAAEVRDGRLYGRGACDTKAGLAAMLHAIADLRHSGTVSEAETWVVAAIDEEHSYRGVVRLLEGLQADAAVVSEPTEMRLVVASRGCLRWRTVVRGKAAHSSKPQLGVNAIFGMARVPARLEADAERLRAMSHPLVGSPTLSVGTIAGGSQVNIVPASCTIEIDRRLIPGEDPQQVFADYQRLIAELRDQYPGLDVSLGPPDLENWPLQTELDSTLVEIACEVLCSHGLNGDPAGVDFGSDAGTFAQAGVPSVIFGPGSIDQAHTADEFVHLEEVETAFLVYRDLMSKYQ